MRKIAFLLSLSLLLSGCAKNSPKAELENDLFAAIPKEPYTVYIEEQNYPYAKYEPQSGCYLGVDISENDDIEGCIEEFENQVGIRHQLYMNSMHIGQVYPLQWVLECYTRDKIPVITITPFDRYSGFDQTDMEQTAKEFGMMDIPIFVQLLPDPLLYECSAEEYVEYYRFVYELFAEKAPNVAFIWSIDRNTIQESEAYYPGDAFVDWVGLNIYEEELNQDDDRLWSQIQYFYYSFQKRKPVLISQLGISHYSTKNHTYQIQEAAERIEEIYEKIQDSFPRIKGVIYVNRNGTDQVPKTALRNDYTVTSDKDLTAAYERAISGDYFGSHPVRGVEQIRSPFPAYLKNGMVYIAEKTWIYDMKRKEERPMIEIDGIRYLALKEGEAEVDSVKKKVFIPAQN